MYYLSNIMYFLIINYFIVIVIVIDWIFNFDVESWLFREQIGKKSLTMPIFWIFEKYAVLTVLRLIKVTLTLVLTPTIEKSTST